MKKRFFIIILIIFGISVYFNSLNNGFVYDDITIITENYFLNNFTKALPDFFSKNYFAIAKETTYRPVGTLTYFLNYKIWGLNPFGYHLSSVFLHIINILLLFYLLNKLFGEKNISFLVSLIYMLHPVLTEAVNGVTFNEDILTTMFFLLSFIFYVKINENKKSGTFYFFFSLFFFFMALISKEIAITLPVIILLYEVLLKDGFSSDNIFKVKSIINDSLSVIIKKRLYYLGFAVVSIIYLYILFVAMKSPDKPEVSSYGSDGLFLRIVYLPYNLFSYIKISCFPFNLCLEHDFHYPSGFFSMENIISYLVVIGVILFSKYIYRYSKKIFFGIWFYIITLLPVLNIIPIYKPVADRILYLPMIGFCLVLGGILTEIFDRLKIENKRLKFGIRAVIIVLILFGYSYLTVTRNVVWKDELTLWGDVVKKNPRYAYGYGELGLAYLDKKMYVEAEYNIRKAIEIDKNALKPYVNLSLLLIEKDRLDDALETINKALEINPDYILGLKKLALIYGIKEQNKEAEDVYKKIIRLRSYDTEAYFNLGLIYAVQGKYNDAFISWEKVLEIDPNNAKARDNIKTLKDNKLM
jgi:protein O-mannosyl-transferase